MRKTVPKMMSLGYPRRLVRDLLENFVRLGIDIGSVLSAQTTTLPAPLSRVEALWRCICDPDSKTELLGFAAGAPLLQHRIEDVYSQLGRSDWTKRTMDAHEKEIGWHVQRLYRMRNAIVHGGYVPENLTNLASHSATYLWVLLRSILDDLASNTGTTDIKSYYEKHLHLNEIVLSALESSSSGQPPFPLLVDPVSAWP